MSSSRFFEDSSNIHFSGNPFFTHANTVTINNFYNRSASMECELGSSYSRRDDHQWLTLRGGRLRIRLIDMSDINILQEISSETLRVLVKLKSTNPFRSRMGSVIKLHRRVESAEIVPGFGGRRFTVVSLEPENDADIEKIQTVLQPLLEVALSRRRVWLTQLFGVGRSIIPTLVYHDEFVNVEAIIEQYEETPIVYIYLLCQLSHSVFCIYDDGTLQKFLTLLSDDPSYWRFNLRTHSFQYDAVSKALSDEDPPRSFDRVFPLPRNCNPPLDSNEIVRALPDYLQMVSVFRKKTYIDRRAGFLRAGLITFGTLVNLTKPGILAYFPSISSPVWSCKFSILGTPDIIPVYSASVPSLLDLNFTKTRNNGIWEMDVRFSLELLPEDRQRLRTAYLVQSFPFYNKYDVSSDLVFIDELGFELTGTFKSDPSSCNFPKYLHVPPISPAWINNMPCLRWPINTPLFYWSFDRNGKMKISEREWKRYGIPDLIVEPYIMSSWEKLVCHSVWEYLSLKKYDFRSGRQFARDHGYPILVEGDPMMSPEAASCIVPRVKNLSWELGAERFGSNFTTRKEKGKAREMDPRVDVQAARAGQAPVVEISH
ncbi:hypothetical protein E1B28_010556 [Marasmius oreades]|uniref:Uncharacterized protein n=1 Tax=Marasmius oreades TaxID=181124 RepID=A0A9P7RXK3_9AGAR|nr:uncharacterized protein E1B28_010556 [Marasmius oreades]KAG7091527.1 hypothetical protein E1B28_010556 [Marasmius oreades]